MADSFPPWVTRVRKDPLGPVGLNAGLLAQYKWVEQLLGAEHILATGECNAAEVPREVGSCYLTAGPTGAVEGFRYATGATRSALGTMQLAIDPTKYGSTSELALQVCSLSESGATKPCITSAIPISTSLIEFYSKKLTSALGAGNAWAAEDAAFAVAIHAPPLARGAPASLAGFGIKGSTFANTRSTLLGTPAGWNPYVAADVGLRSAFLAEHSSAGKHTGREVARTFAQIQFAGGAYRLVSDSTRNPTAAITTVGTGHCKITWSNAWSLSAQPFVMPDYAKANGGAAGDIIVCCCPRTLITATQVEFFFYKYDTGAKTWNYYDTDFFAVVHGGA